MVFFSIVFIQLTAFRHHEMNFTCYLVALLDELLELVHRERHERRQGLGDAVAEDGHPVGRDGALGQLRLPLLQEGLELRHGREADLVRGPRGPEVAAVAGPVRVRCPDPPVGRVRAEQDDEEGAHEPRHA